MSESAAMGHWSDAPPTVGAVLVTHNGATWLPRVLASFSSMDHAPTVWRAVDVASSDGSGALVAGSFGAERVLRAPRGSGFGAAVRLGIEAMPRTDWVWLLHDDASVLPGTLSGLLDVATSADDIAVVGPKIREWPSLRRLLEVGLTITGTGDRVTGLEPGEPDAGQHDRPRDVLAVSSAGMLIRRDVWDQLDGFDPDLPSHFDDIDFGWRVARAGYRTVTAPAGVIFHVEASTRGVRRGRAPHRRSWEKRRAGLFVQLANTGSVRLWWQYPRLVLGSLLRVLGLIIARDPESAGDELLAVRSLVAHPKRLHRARRRRRQTSVRGNRAIRELFASPWLPYQHGMDSVRSTFTAMVRPETIETVGRRSNVEHTPVEVEELDDGPPLHRRRPWFVTVVVLALISLIASRSVIGGLVDGMSGGALLRAPDTTGGWWSLLLDGSRAPGLSGDAAAPVFAIPLALAGLPVWFAPEILVGVLMVLAVPMAGLSAHRLGRQISTQRGPRIMWAVTYAACVAAVGAVPQGRLGTLVALIVVPIIINTMLQLVTAPHWQTALRLATWIAVGAAFAPIVAVMALVALLVVAGWQSRSRGPSTGREVAVTVVVAALLLGPWLFDRAAIPTRWWWEAGRPVPGIETVVDIVAGRAGGVQAPWWLSVPLLVLGVLALLPRATRSAVAVAWLSALMFLAVALLGHHTWFTASSGTAEIAPWVGVPSVLWLASLATAALLAAPALTATARPVAVATLVAVAVLPLGAGAWWVVSGPDGSLARNPAQQVPAFLSDRPGLTLVLSGNTDDGISYRTIAGSGPFLGQEAVEPTEAQSGPLSAAVQRLLGPGSQGDVEALSAAGIGAIYAADVDPEIARRIDAAPLVAPSGSDASGSRSWVLSQAPEVDGVQVPVWRRVVSGLQVLVWVGVIVLTIPVRRRPDPMEELLDETDSDLQAGSVP